MLSELRVLLTRLRGMTLKTLDRGRLFDVVGFDQTGVAIYIHSTRKERAIPVKELEGAYQGLLARKTITRIEIEARYSPRNPAFVAAILAQVEGVEVRLKPITLRMK